MHTGSTLDRQQQVQHTHSPPHCLPCSHGLQLVLPAQGRRREQALHVELCKFLCPRRNWTRHEAQHAVPLSESSEGSGDILCIFQCSLPGCGRPKRLVHRPSQPVIHLPRGEVRLHPPQPRVVDHQPCQNQRDCQGNQPRE